MKKQLSLFLLCLFPMFAIGEDYPIYWPAFWMMPEDWTSGWPTCGEIDIFESIDNKERAWHTIHSNWSYNLKNTNNPKSTSDESVTSWAVKHDPNFTYETLFDWVRVYQSRPTHYIPTDVENILCKDSTQAEGVYDLSGRKIAETPTSAMQRGLYVYKGKKIVIK